MSVKRFTGEPSGWQMSVMQMDSSVRPSGGTSRPRAIISLRSNAAVSGTAVTSHVNGAVEKPANGCTACHGVTEDLFFAGLANFAIAQPAVRVSFLVLGVLFLGEAAPDCREALDADDSSVIDLTDAMLRRALPRATHVDFTAVRGDAQRLPFATGSFDVAVLHLILAVVPDPARCFAEIGRVLRPGGEVLVFDKFLRHGEAAPLRRLANPFVSRFATRLDVVFEPLLDAAPGLRVEHDQPALAGGWFRMIRLRKAL